MSFRFRDSFDGKRVFVTGNTGFKGSWLSLWLAARGAEVTGYALEPPTDPSNFDVSNVEGFIHRQHYADVRDHRRLATAMVAAEPELVLHLAAQTVVRTGYEAPRDTFDVNVMGTVNVLEAVRELRRPIAVLCVTSDKCYENTERTWGYRECDAMGDHDPYGGSKGAAELAIRAYQHSFFPKDRLAEHGVRLASARAGNVIGGGDWTKHALIVDVVHSLTKGVPVEIRSPIAFRPWQHVLQCLSGYLTIAAELLESDDPQVCSGWNIGPLPGNEISVAEVVNAFIDAWGDGTWIDASDPAQVREAMILRLSIDKALWQLNWRPMWSVYEAIEQTAAWYQQYLSHPADMQPFSLHQIQLYEEALGQATGGEASQRLQASAR